SPPQPRWVRRRLADQLRRSETLLRSRRSPDRSFRQRRGPAQQSGRDFSAAARAALLRAADQASRGQAARHVYSGPAVHSHAAAERPTRLSSLRPVQPRLQDELEFLEHVRARVVVLAASACESARLLLNSKSSRFPQGLANSSGVVGRYLTDTTGTDVAGYIPKMVDHVPHNEDGVGGNHLYMPWWLDNRNLDFPRGYH